MNWREFAKGVRDGMAFVAAAAALAGLLAWSLHHGGLCVVFSTAGAVLVLGFGVIRGMDA